MIFLFIGCKPKSFWLLNRHGSRNPDDKEIELINARGFMIQKEIIENHANGQGKINTNKH